MLGYFRRLSNTWVARILFLVLVVAFAGWGVSGDVLRMISHGTWAAKVSGITIEPPQLQEAYRRSLDQFTRMLAGRTDPSPEMRRLALSQALDQVLVQTALAHEADRLGLAVPDPALRDAVFQMPAFHDKKTGAFDRATFEQALRSNGYTEARFFDAMREDMARRQLLAPVRAGAAAPDQLVRQVFAYEQQKRVASMVEFPFAAAPDPAPTAEAVLTRWWDNHPDAYSTPEFRRVKAVVLSPETLAKDVAVPDEDLRAAYDQHKVEFQQPEKRSAQIITTGDQKAAETLAATWRAGADWAKMQEAAKAAGASAVALEDATRAEFPAAELAQAVFGAAPDAVSDPVKTPLGWDIVRVTKVQPGVSRSFEDVKPALRDRLAQERAKDLVYDRMNKVEDALAGGAKLDELPSDLGLVGVTGTMDAQGNTPQGTPAPIPGGAELRSQLIADAFRLKVGDPPHLTEVTGQEGGTGAYFAVSVEQVTPPSRRPFAEVKDKVLADWTADARRREQNVAATKLYAAVKGGQSLEDAATVAGVRIDPLPPVGRAGGAEGVPTPLQAPLFGLKKGEPTMVETADGFVVAVLTDIQQPDPNADPIGYGRMRDALARSLGDDYENTLAMALRDRGKPQVNQPVLDQMVQQ